MWREAGLSYPPRLSEHVKRSYTDAQLTLMKLLNKADIPFISEEPIWFPDKEMPYIVDIFVDRKLVVEVQGDAHKKKWQKDEEREKFFIEHGLGYLEFNNDEIYKEPDRVVRVIKEAWQKIIQ